MLETFVDNMSGKISRQTSEAYQMVVPQPVPYGVAEQYKHTKARGLDVYYEDSKHVYFVQTGQNRFPLISATSLIEFFNPEFKVEEMSLKCAKKTEYTCNCLNKEGWESLTVEQKAERIAAAWKENNEDATSYGTAAHMANEYLAKHPEMSDEQIYQAVVARCGQKAARPIIRTILPNVRQMLAGFKASGYECIAEPVLVEPSMCLAGQSDLVMVHHEQKKIWILDYKTNKECPGTTTAYNKMLGYFEQYDSTEWYHYSIQLSLYYLMLLQQYPGYSVEQMTLLWLCPHTGKVNPLAIDVAYWIPVILDFKQYYMLNQIPNRIYTC